MARCRAAALAGLLALAGALALPATLEAHGSSSRADVAERDALEGDEATSRADPSPSRADARDLHLAAGAHDRYRRSVGRWRLLGEVQVPRWRSGSGGEDAPASGALNEVQLPRWRSGNGGGESPARGSENRLGGTQAADTVLRAIAVAARDLPRGATLTAADIRYEPQEDTGGSPMMPGVGPGWITRRVIAAGEALREPAVGQPQLIRSGDSVELVWREGALELRLRGTAMGSATEGERVTVRVDTWRRMEGVAVGPGLVHINGGSGER